MRCVLCWQVLQLSGAGIKPDDIKLVVRSAESGGVRATAYLEAEIPTANQISETLKATTKEKASAPDPHDPLEPPSRFSRTDCWPLDSYRARGRKYWFS